MKVMNYYHYDDHFPSLNFRIIQFRAYQFSSVAQLCPCDPMNRDLFPLLLGGLLTNSLQLSAPSGITSAT